MSEPRTWTFRDAGLHSRPLRALNVAGAGLRRLGWTGPSLEPDALVRAATRKAGLEDFGAPGYREALEVLAAALEDEADLNLFGRVAMRGMLIGALANRLALLDWAKRHPEVRDESIERPWIILGLPRTGTTLLSHLLALDPLNRPLRSWEAAAPLPPPALADHAEDPRIAATARQLEGLARLNPAFRAMHPLGATLPTECVTLLMFDLRSLQIETQASLPSYGSWLEKTDMGEAYRLHRLTLQVLQSRLPTGAWSLKTPNHLWCLETLRETYPGARLAWTHRDPRKVVPSVASLNTTLQTPFARRTDPRAVGREWNHKLHLGLSRGMAFDEAQTGGSWCAHLLYADLMADPLAALRRLYAHFGEELHPLHARRIEAWLRARPQETFGRHGYAAEDFGLSLEGIGEQYAAYIERFRVPEEA